MSATPEPASTGARTRGRSPGGQSRLGSWFDHHVYSVVASVGRMLRKPWATALTVGVMAVAIALPLGLWIALANVERFAGDVQRSRQVQVFLEPTIDVDRARALAESLRGRADVAAVELRTPEQGLAELREQGGLDVAIEALDGNPLPSVLLVTPAGDGALLAGTLRTTSRAYAIGDRGLERANVGEIFLYYALPYEESVRRAVTWQLRERAGTD